MPSTLRARLAELVSDAQRLSQSATPKDSDRIARTLVDSLPFPALIANNGGRYVVANRAASEVTGYSRQELLELSVWDLTPPTSQRDAEVLWRAFIQQREQTGEYVLVKNDGRAITMVYAARAHFLPGLHLSLLEGAVR